MKMAPPKGNKKDIQKQETAAKIEEPINSDSWKCVVMMAVEKTHCDSFVLKEFIEESSSGRRQEIGLIDFDTFVMKILNDIENGELSYKYSFLLNFSSVFQEAISYKRKKIDIPVIVLVKVIKALLFYLREESLLKIKKANAGYGDPIKAMAERPVNFGMIDTKNKETTKKGDNALKLKPPSVTKLDTELLKRGERAKDDQRINDAPTNAYFSLYVLLTGFYHPELPLELIKAGIPLHALLCIDTSFSGVKRDATSTRYKNQKQNFEAKSQEIQNFWKVFLKILWDPKVQFYFTDIIFQVYVPQRLLCEKKALGEFIYREISCLLYDLSDLKRTLNNYLDHLHLRSITEENVDLSGTLLGFENLSEECITVPVVLQFIIDAVCKKQKNHKLNPSCDHSNSTATVIEERESELLRKSGNYVGDISWNKELEEGKDFNLLNIYLKTKELDVKYDLEDKSFYCTESEKTFNEIENSQLTCNFQVPECGKNMEEALLLSDGIFRFYWKKHQKEVNPIFVVDYCLYSLLMTKIVCPYQLTAETSQISTTVTSQVYQPVSYHSNKKNSTFETIENLSREIRKPHFTVTEGSRSILKSIPYNIKNTSKDFFCPEEFKIVSPEKLKGSSAPEFRMPPNLQILTSFASEVLPATGKEIPTTTFETLRGFVDECLFSNTNDFYIIEFLSKPKLLEKEHQHWASYNCIDDSYSLLNDCIFLVLHNRKDKQNIYHETFNKTLRTPVGLRDFYEFVMEDESTWLENQEQMYQTTVFLANKILESGSLKSFTSSEFWLADSLKCQYFKRQFKEPEELKMEVSKLDKLGGKQKIELSNFSLMSDSLEGYDLGNSTVQYSGLKTVYYTKDCNVTVQLIEKLYGDQELGIHVTAASGTLHLYSYVCPEPHILDPFIFHITYRNGIIIAFGRRMTEMFEEVEEIIESRTPIKGKKNSSELSTRIVKKLVPKAVKDEEFMYDMVASFPNGLSIRAVRKIVKPCYIKQQYLGKAEEPIKFEASRLFLPSGNLVKIFKDDTVQILKVNGSVVTANLNDLIRGTDTESLYFSKFEFVSSEGFSSIFEQGEVISSERLHIFQNSDVSTGEIFFRRRDGTNYKLQSDGSLCVQFKDGTKMLSSIFMVALEPSLIEESDSVKKDETFWETDFEIDFVFVYLKIIIEHPDYATVEYDTQTQKWRILLPYDSTITVKPKGHYTVKMDNETEFTVETDFLQVNKFSCEQQSQYTFTADLSVFESNEGGIYCHLEDTTGKIFIVEANSNCYILDDEEISREYESQKESTFEVQPKESDVSEFVASADLQICPSIKSDKNKKLSPENKYFVIRRDMTGVELLQVNDVRKELMRAQKGSLVFSQEIPNTERRCFVLISPKPMEKIKKWAVNTIIPDPKYKPGAQKRTLSSTYGVPPSWMHPFPKRKIKFTVPQPLTCRVFLETVKTNLSPEIGTLNYYNCELDEVDEVKHSRIPADGVEEYLKKLSNDDQDILKEMYTLAAASLINEKKRLKPNNSEKLKHYLEMSKYVLEMREYHKKSIRYHIVPNYFHHPAGISWLILNDLLNRLEFSLKTTKKQAILKKPTGPKKLSRSLGSSGGFSYEEIEYDLSLSAGQSFSDLSCRSNLSAQTAPAVLRTGGVCKCKVKSARDTSSSPVMKCFWTDQTFIETNFSEPHSRVCDLQENIEMVKKIEEYEERELAPMTLDDLMYLGLI